MDFGYPQNLSPEILKLYITQEGVRSPFSSKVFFCHYCSFCCYYFLKPNSERNILKNYAQKIFLFILYFEKLICYLMFSKEENYGLFLSIISPDKCYEELTLNLILQPQDSRPPANATLQVTGAVGWRREGLFYFLWWWKYVHTFNIWLVFWQ